MKVSKIENYTFRFFFLFYVFFVVGCSSDDSKNLFDCCNSEIDGNVNNLPDPPDGEERQNIEVFNVITPNGDGINDFWIVQNLYLYPNNTVEIFNSNNKLVFSTNGYHSNGEIFPTEDISEGTYRYKIVIENEDVFLLQGYLCVITNPNNFRPGSGCNPLSLQDPFLQ